MSDGRFITPPRACHTTPVAYLATPVAYLATPVAYLATPDAAITAMGPPELQRSQIGTRFSVTGLIPFHLVEDESLRPQEPEREYSFEAEYPCSENPELTAREVEAHNANMEQTNAKMEEDHGRPY